MPLVFMDWVHDHLKHRNSCAAAPGKYFLHVTLLITIQGWRWRTQGLWARRSHWLPGETFQRRGTGSNLCSSPVGPPLLPEDLRLPASPALGQGGFRGRLVSGLQLPGTRELWVPVHSEPKSHLIGHLWPQVPGVAGGENLSQQVPPGSRHFDMLLRRWDKMWRGRWAEFITFSAWTKPQWPSAARLSVGPQMPPPILVSLHRKPEAGEAGVLSVHWSSSAQTWIRRLGDPGKADPGCVHLGVSWPSPGKGKVKAASHQGCRSVRGQQGSVYS